MILRALTNWDDPPSRGFPKHPETNVARQLAPTGPIASVLVGRFLRIPGGGYRPCKLMGI